MKAILYRYGPPDVLRLQDEATPTPKANEVLVRVHASSVNALEWRRFALPPFFVRIMSGGLREPKDSCIGADLAGRVEAVGANVTRFQTGNEVFGLGRGAFAEYVCASEDNLVRKPANISFEAAAALPIAGLSALQALRDKGRIQPGHKVLINGAGGGVGTFAVQIAKSLGAEVTAVCSSRNVAIARSIGADHVIDYSKEDFTENGQRYDLIVAVNGYHSILVYRRVLKPNGAYVMVGGSWAQVLQGLLLGPFLSHFGSKKMKVMMTRINHQDLMFLGDLLGAGRVVPVIDRQYALADVPEAIKYLLGGHAQGKVVITCGTE